MINRNAKTGRYESDNSDPMTKMMIEKYQNSRGMRILREMIAIDAKQRAEASKNE